MSNVQFFRVIKGRTELGVCRITHDFDPSGSEHPEYCMCPCCDLAEGKMCGEEE